MLKNKVVPIILGCCFILGALFSFNSSSPLLSDIRARLENILYDTILKINLTTKAPKFEIPIVIVDIDEKSISQEGRWPWPRSKVASLVQKIQEAGAIVIAFDITFSQPEANALTNVLDKWRIRDPSYDKRAYQQLENLLPDFDYDSIFAQRLTIGENVLGFVLLNDMSVPARGQLPSPIPITPAAANIIPELENYRANIAKLQQAAKHGGFVTVWPDSDGVLRRIFLLLQYQNNAYPSLALETIRRYLLIDKIDIQTAKVGQTEIMTAIQLGSTRIPTNAVGEVYIPYVGPARSFPYLSATDVLNDQAKKELLMNAIVFIGSAAPSLHDIHATAIDPNFPGTEVHANIANALLSGHFPYQPDWAAGVENLMIIFVGLICTLSFPFLGAMSILLLTSALLAGLFFAYGWLLRDYYLILSILFPFLLIVSTSILNFIYGFFSEFRQRRQLKDIFGQYLPASRVELMSKNPTQYSFEGESKELTVLFADIRGFTTISESLSAPELRNLLNRFFTTMTEIIFKHKGTIDKYVGDMVMAFWGAPEDNPTHATDALKAAIEMIETTEKLKTEFLAEGLPKVEIGVGLNSGPMYVGDMGSKFRRSYTVLGDNVNLAARLQDLTKFYYCKIVVGASTQQGQGDFVFRKLDRTRVKGKKLPVEIFEVIGERKNVSENLLAELSHYEPALECYFAQKWDEAEEKFNALIKNYADRPLYTLYLQRIKIQRQKPLDKNWDGVYEHEHK